MIKPMLATLEKKPFDHEDWIFEIKWDGYRILAEKKKQIKLLSRNAISFNDFFPTIAQELSTIPYQFLLDGEVVVFDEKKNISFQQLQNKQARKNAYYYVFDILFFQKNDLRNLPLIDRKKILDKFLSLYQTPHIICCEYIEKEGKKLFSLVKKQGLEGIMAKKKTSLYFSTRSREWLKIKTHQRQEVVIGGFTGPRKSRKYFGSLLVGIYDNKELIYIGNVGTGFNTHTLESLYLKMHKLISKNSPFKNKPLLNMPITWLKPILVCEVSFAEWTKDNKLRQPVFQGLRIDKIAKAVTKEISLDYTPLTS